MLHFDINMFDFYVHMSSNFKFLSRDLKQFDMLDS